MKASRKLTLFQRGLNRLGRPLGILPYPMVWMPDEGDRNGRAGTFDHILRENVWNSSESVSGPGSELRRTATYRNELVNFLRCNGVKSVFDAPCGDLNWMSKVLQQLDLDYVGGDVSPAVLELARSRFPALDLRQFDICEDDFPAADVWHCRDTFLHLSFADVWKALENAARSDVRFALLSTHRGRLFRNMDVATGGARPLDLEREPFSFPRPSEYLRDSSGWAFPRAVGVWSIETVRSVVEKRDAR